MGSASCRARAASRLPFPGDQDAPADGRGAADIGNDEHRSTGAKHDFCGDPGVVARLRTRLLRALPDDREIGIAGVQRDQRARVALFAAPFSIEAVLFHAALEGVLDQFCPVADALPISLDQLGHPLEPVKYVHANRGHRIQRGDTSPEALGQAAGDVEPGAACLVIGQVNQDACQRHEIPFR